MFVLICRVMRVYCGWAVQLGQSTASTEQITCSQWYHGDHVVCSRKQNKSKYNCTCCIKDIHNRTLYIYLYIERERLYSIQMNESAAVCGDCVRLLRATTRNPTQTIIISYYAGAWERSYIILREN